MKRIRCRHENRISHNTNIDCEVSLAVRSDTLISVSLGVTIHTTMRRWDLVAFASAPLPGLPALGVYVAGGRVPLVLSLFWLRVFAAFTSRFCA